MIRLFLVISSFITTFSFFGMLPDIITKSGGNDRLTLFIMSLLFTIFLFSIDKWNNKKADFIFIVGWYIVSGLFAWTGLIGAAFSGDSVVAWLSIFIYFSILIVLTKMNNQLNRWLKRKPKTE